MRRIKMTPPQFYMTPNYALRCITLPSEPQVRLNFTHASAVEATLWRIGVPRGTRTTSRLCLRQFLHEVQLGLDSDSPSRL